MRGETSASRGVGAIAKTSGFAPTSAKAERSRRGFDLPQVAVRCTLRECVPGCDNDGE